MWDEAPALIKEWTRILKVGGQLRINLPNLAYAAREILRADEDPNVDVGLYPTWQVYGKQTGCAGEIHRNGFTQHGLKRLLEFCGLGSVDVSVHGDYGENLEAVATKVVHASPLALGPAWRAIEQAEHSPATNGSNGHHVSVPLGPIPVVVKPRKHRRKPAEVTS
jgi:hypothetical protein